MKIINDKKDAIKELKRISSRTNSENNNKINKAVEKILLEVKSNGDEAIEKYAIKEHLNFGKIYSYEIDASKIPVEWYSWIHFTANKIEKTHDLKKYDWQKPHQPNLTGTDSAYYPYKNKNVNVKKYKPWKKD